MLGSLEVQRGSGGISRPLGTSKEVVACASSKATTLPTFDLLKVMQRVKKETKWPQNRLDRAEHDYLLFLQRAKQTRGKVEPTKDVDKVWHAHILYTRQYATDCLNYFGYFLHHQPHEATMTCSGSGCMNNGVTNARSECSPDSDCHGDGSCGGDV